jgi:hypothetical protein
MTDNAYIPGAAHREKAAEKKVLAQDYAKAAEKYEAAGLEEAALAAESRRLFKMSRAMPERERDVSLPHVWQAQKSNALRARLNFGEAAAWRRHEARANLQALTHKAIATVETFAAKLGLI